MGIYWGSPLAISLLEKAEVVCYILIDFGILMKLVKFFQICFSGICRKIWIGNICLIHFIFIVVWNE